MAIKRIDNVLEGTGVVFENSPNAVTSPSDGIDWAAYKRRDVSIFPALQAWFDKNPGETLTFPPNYECRFEGELRFHGTIDCNDALVIWVDKDIAIVGTGAEYSVLRNCTIEHAFDMNTVPGAYRYSVEDLMVEELKPATLPG